MTMHRYDLFGLKISSEYSIAWAPEADDARPSDVVIRRGPLPEAVHESDPNSLQFSVPAVARYHIADGCEIIVDALADADADAVRVYLLGSALGVLLHQRGLLVLHANAIVIDGQATLFLGASGAGKSTLAAWFANRGYAVLTDDICAVEVLTDGGISVLPGLTRLRLSDEAAVRLAFDPAGAARCPTSDKFELSLSHVQARQAMKLGACYLLSAAPDAATRIHSLKAVDAVEMLMANTYRGFALQQLGKNAGHWSACVRLANEVPCFSAERPKDWAQLDAVGEELARHARGRMLAA